MISVLPIKAGIAVSTGATDGWKFTYLFYVNTWGLVKLCHKIYFRINRCGNRVLNKK
jgi:hypothetical protein